MKQWTKDLTVDIRTKTSFDDKDEPDWNIVPTIPRTNSVCNIQALENEFLKVKDNCLSIVEIGVAREIDSFTNVFLKNKRKDCFYFGIDTENKSFLNNPDENVFTIETSSSNIAEITSFMAYYFVHQIDFLFIDGWHSINQVLEDWEFTRLLSPNGVVGLHDTNYHPGPTKFIEALDKNIYNVNRLCTNADDYGISFITRK